MRDLEAEQRAAFVLNEARTIVRKAGVDLKARVDTIEAIHLPVFKRGVDEGGLHNAEGARPIRDMELQGHDALSHLRLAYEHIEKARKALGDEVAE